MHLLIDGDVLVYRSAFGAQKTIDGEVIADPPEYAVHNIKNTLTMMQNELSPDRMTVYLSAANDPTNFRVHVATIQPYKGNRKDAIRPVHYEVCRQYLIDYKDAIVVTGQEADDALGIEQMTNYTTVQRDRPDEYVNTGESCIASLDKDLDMIPGPHYNWPKKHLYYVSPETGLKNFYTQILVGDRVDNIPGLKGIGPVKAKKMLLGADTEEEMFTRVRYAYENDARLLEVGRLLWIRRQPDEMWEFPL